jgi:CheY-like chemotaxis protein
MRRREDRQDTIVQPLVMVVDDDPSVCEALGSLLAPRLEPFYRVETAASADEALELLSAPADGHLQTPVALVISDERMPGRSGTDLLIALRRHPLHRDGGRIIITAYAGLPSAERAINESASPARGRSIDSCSWLRRRDPPRWRKLARCAGPGGRI